MKRDNKYRSLFLGINNFLVFFLMVAFIITCCMMLFVTILSASLGIELNSENLEVAAKVTLINVVVLSLICTLIDMARRKYTVDRPASHITEAAKKMMQGDFSVRIPAISSFANDDKFNEIIECMNKMAQELSGIETLRTDFIANVSHELKTPLAVIQNYSTMLAQPDLSDEERREYAKTITAASQNLSGLISNILKLNKLENQQIYPTSQVYDLGEQLCECLLGFESTWEKKGIEIETDIDDGIFVKTDSEMMTLVWNNLFSNAFKFTDRGGTVSLSLKAEDGYATVRIADTGCGISKEVGAHMFEKFYQGDTSHSTQGNGLGLTLVKRIIDITGSDIAVESELDKGTVFTVKIRRVYNGTL